MEQKYRTKIRTRKSSLLIGTVNIQQQMTLVTLNNK